MKINYRFIISFLLAYSFFFAVSTSLAADICINTSLSGYIDAEDNDHTYNPPGDQRFRMRKESDTAAYGGKVLETYNDGSGLSETFWYGYDIDSSQSYYVWVRGKGTDSSNNRLQFQYKNTSGNWSTARIEVAFENFYSWKKVWISSVTMTELRVGAVMWHDAVRLDGIYITTDSTAIPIDGCTGSPSITPEAGVCGDIPLYTQNLTFPAMMVQLDVSGSMSWEMFDNDANEREFYSNDLSEIVQEMVNRDDWDSGDNIGFRVMGRLQTQTRSVDSADSNEAPPRLVITYLDSNSNEQTIDIDITNGGDDVSFNGGTISSTGTHIKLGPDRYGGFLFRNINIPRNATIVESKLQFDLANDGDQTRPARLEVRAITDPQKESFTAADFGPTADISEAYSFLNYTKLDYAVTTLEEIFKDQGIAWGFSTWTSRYSSGIKYTKYHVGIRNNDTDHMDNLIDSLYNNTYASYGTPLTPTILASKDYFDGNRYDETYGEKYVSVHCQPKVVVVVTDGEGNTGTTDIWDSWGSATNTVIGSGVSVVTIGFGPDLSSSYQLDRIALVAQERGNNSDVDKIYGLHHEEPREVDNIYSNPNSIRPVEGPVGPNASVKTVGVPFLGARPEAFIEAMNSIVSAVKLQQYHGVAPSPTTSTSDEGVLVIASFNPETWVGDIEVNKIDPVTGGVGAKIWQASEVFAENGGVNNNNCYIYNPVTGSVELYDDSSLPNDNYMCKNLGDIINSEPKIVSRPPYFYEFDGYEDYKYNSNVRARDSMIYVGSNDGAVHAFLLEYGTKWNGVPEASRPKLGSEMWRFYPRSVRAKINTDMCASDYCHEYVNDGSPQAADIYNGTSWKTILTGGIGRGGPGFYTLDITYGNDMSAGTTNPSSLLWEFTSADDSQLGMATAVPEIKRIDKKYSSGAAVPGSTWATFFGSGSAVVATDQLSRYAHIYGVNSWDKSTIWEDANGNPIKKVRFGTFDPDNPSVLLANDIPSSPLVVDHDSEDDKSDRIYVGNRYGNLFRINDIAVGDTPTVYTLYDSKLVTHESPVTAKPVYTYAGNNDAWIYFGTGKYEITADKTTDYQQYLFGLKDEGANRTTPYEYGDLRECQLGSVTASDGTVYRTVTCDPGSGPWVLKLERTAGQPSERLLAKPLVIGGIVYFTTFIPGTDVCGESGRSYILAVDWKTGGVPPEDPFPDMPDTITESGVSYTVIGKDIGAGVASGINALGSDGFYATSNSGVGSIALNNDKLKVKLKSWKQEYK